MTRGSMLRHMGMYILPLVAANMLQQLYNVVASIVVGRFVGQNAFAAVGVASPIINLATFLIVGFGMGASVIMASMFGAGEYDRVKTELSTSVIAGSVLTVAMSGAAMLLATPVLRLIRTPEEILPDTAAYLRVVFVGLVFSFLYNIYSSAFLAVGDSKSPLVFLILSSLLNIGLTCLFVIVLDIGMLGAAMANVASQGASAVLIICYAYRKIPLFALKRSEFRVDRELLKMTAGYSLVTAAQQSCTYVGKLLVQGAVNPLGVDAIAAYNAVARTDEFLLAPIDSNSSMVHTFVAQNRGAGNPGRIKSGLRAGVVIAACYSVLIGLLVFSVPGSIIRLFLESDNTEPVVQGIAYLKPIACLYFFASVDAAMQGFFRGFAKPNITLIGSSIHITIRVLFTWRFAGEMGLAAVAYGTGIGWMATFVFLIVMTRFTLKRHPVFAGK